MSRRRLVSPHYPIHNPYTSPPCSVRHKRVLRPSQPCPPVGTAIPAPLLTYLWSVTADSSPSLFPNVWRVLPILVWSKRPLLLLARSLKRLRNVQVLSCTPRLDTLYPKLQEYNVKTEKQYFLVPILLATPCPYYLHKVLPYIYALFRPPSPRPGLFRMTCPLHYLGHSLPVLLSAMASPSSGPLHNGVRLIP